MKALGDAVIEAVAEYERFTRAESTEPMRTYGGRLGMTPKEFSLGYARARAADYLVKLHSKGVH